MRRPTFVPEPEHEGNGDVGLLDVLDPVSEPEVLPGVRLPVSMLRELAEGRRSLYVLTNDEQSELTDEEAQETSSE
jgi:hypothetical protein